MKLILVCMLLTSQFITLLALRNVTKQVYCTKQTSVYSSLEFQLQESVKGKHLDDASHSVKYLVFYIDIIIHLSNVTPTVRLSQGLFTILSCCIPGDKIKCKY